MIEDTVFEILSAFIDNARRTDTELIAPCPFHVKPDGSRERHPSFNFSLTKGIYHCHACHEAGTFFTFMQHLGVAAADIKDRYGHVLKHFWLERGESTPDQKSTWSRVLNHSQLPESLLGLFHYCPVSLINEGFSEKTLNHFEIGYDAYHHRITFPIRDFQGNLIGISGRSFGDVQPRYKVYRQEYRAFDIPLHETDKSLTLWNGHSILEEVLDGSKEVPFIVLVEGFKACMKVWQSGITNVVALLGSSISRAQAWFLERMGATVILMLDNNDAGIKGTEKVGKLLMRSLKVRIAQYQKEQPSDCTDQEIQEAIQTNLSFATLEVNRLILR